MSAAALACGMIGIVALACAYGSEETRAGDFMWIALFALIGACATA